MIKPQHKLSIRKQSELLEVNRNRPKPSTRSILEEDQEIMLKLYKTHEKYCHMGQCPLILELRATGCFIGRKRVRKLMKLMGIRAMVAQPYTSKKAKVHKIYPYLLKNNKVTEVDEVWCTDITYTPMPKGHVYLIAIMDWHSRAFISWEVFNTMDSAFYLRALR